MIEKENKILNTAIDYGIYLYIILMFLTKGEAVKNVLLYGTFTFWLISLRWKNHSYFWKNYITILFFVYIAICFLSVFVSVDPFYSLDAMSKELLKGIVLFPMLATHFNSEQRLKGLAAAFTISAIILVVSGYYSYFTDNISVLKPNLSFIHLWHNKFARYLNSTLPFVFILLLFSRKLIFKILLSSFIFISVFALILSTSRGGYGAFIMMALVWAAFLAKAVNLNIKKTAIITILIFISISAAAFELSPGVRQRMTGTGIDISTFNLRTRSWIPALEVIKGKPILGWGYGPKMVTREEPYLNTPYKAPPIGAHNTFLLITFTTGIIGLISYITLLIYALYYCWQQAVFRNITSFSSYMLIAVFSVLIGNYFVHSILEIVSFTGLSVLFGIAVASANLIHEDCNHP